MSILDRIRGERHPGVKTALFRLTKQGEAKLQDGFSGSSNYRILEALQCMGSSGNLDDIARDSHIPQGRLEHLLPILLRQGMISTTSTQGADYE